MVLDWPQHRNGSKPVTTALNQAIFHAAAVVLSQELPHATTRFITALEQCRTSQQWRRDYIQLMEQFVQLQSQVVSSSLLIESCRAALDCANQSFVVRRNNNNPPVDDEDEEEEDSLRANHTTTITIEQAFAVPYDPSSVLPTETLTGTATTTTSTSQFQLASPHGTDTDPVWVSGADAIAQVNAWHSYGCMEASAAHHANAILSAPDASEFVTNQTFCILGITSEMGPTTHLLQLPGAHVMGVARAGSKIDALKGWFRSNGPVGTTLQLTTADLLNDFVAIAQWIVATAPIHQPLVLMPLAYMDGEANVRVTVAMDAIVSYVIQHRGGNNSSNRSSSTTTSANVSLVYLTSPTTIYTIPKEAALDTKQRYDNLGASWTNQMLSLASFGHWLRPSNSWKQLDQNDDNDTTSSNDGTHKNDPIIVYNGAYHLQGPNYCLSKLMQQWRCMVAHADPRVRSVHAPHAPGTRTWSVRHNPQVAVAMEGIQYFSPMITFDVVPCSSLLTAIVLHQLHLDKTMKSEYHHPMELFWDGAVHGGGWRCPYSSESIVALTFVLGKAWAQPGWCPLGALAPKPT